MIYLDHNATTPIDDRVLEAMLPFLKSLYGNPSSLYRYGRITRSALDTAREQVAALIDAPSSKIIFTSGGTESNTLALTGCSSLSKLAVSAIEHPSIAETATRLKKIGASVKLLPVDNNGLITQEAIENTIKDKPDLVSIMLANNETGTIQNLSDITQQLKELDITIHTDAVQAAGKIPVSFIQLGVQLMSLSSHKIYGPKGCGALIVEKHTLLNPLFLGGDQEQGLRAGTENIAAIVGFGKAAELAKSELNKRTSHLLKLRNLLEDGLKTIPGLTIFAQLTQRLPNTVQFGIPKIDGEMMLMNLDKKGFAISSGSACASGGNLPSPVLLAMNIESGLAKSALRVSLGITNTAEDISEFINQLKTLVYQV